VAKTTEIVRRIWDDDEGVCFEIRPDQDGLDVIELHTSDAKSKEYYGAVRFTMDKDMARKIGEALIAAANDA
jgi:hypothetical protein